MPFDATPPDFEPEDDPLERAMMGALGRLPTAEDYDALSDNVRKHLREMNGETDE